MQHTSVEPTIGASVENGQLELSGGLLGTGGSSMAGVQDGNLTDGSTSATNWGSVTTSENTQSSSLGADGLKTNETHMDSLGGDNGIKSESGDSSIMDSSGFHTSNHESFSIGGQEIYHTRTTNDNCCCSWECGCFGKDIECGTMGCFDAIGGCCNSSFNIIQSLAKSSVGFCAAACSNKDVQKGIGAAVAIILTATVGTVTATIL